MSAGTPAMRAGPRTTQLARWRNMQAAGAIPVEAPHSVREWDQDLMDRIHRKSYGIEEPIEVRNGAPGGDNALVGLEDGAGGLGQMAVPAEPRSQPKVGSPAWKRQREMRLGIANKMGINVDDLTDDEVQQAMASRRSEAKTVRGDTEAMRRKALAADVQKRKEARQSGGFDQSSDPYQNLANYAAMTNNPEFMNAAVAGMSAREAEKGASQRAKDANALRGREIDNQAESTKLEREQRDQQFQLEIKRADAAEKAHDTLAKQAEMKGDHAEAQRQREFSANAQQSKQQHEQLLEQSKQQHTERMAADNAKNKPVTRDEYATSISNNHTPDEVKQLLDDWDNAHAAPGGAAQPAPSRVERDMAAGKLTPDVYKEMRQLHPNNLFSFWPDSLTTEDSYKDALRDSFRQSFPDIPPTVMKKLVDQYYARYTSIDGS
jgi:hypothetical protein